MIWDLPTSLSIGNKTYSIRSDFRNALLIFTALNDPELTTQNREFIMLDCLYCDFPTIPKNNLQEASEKAVWFLDGGDVVPSKKVNKKIIDWEQDARIYFPAINKVIGKEVRHEPYLHWWTFLGLFTEMGECLYSTVLNIRKKRAERKKLEKWENDFYVKNKEIFDIKEKLSEREAEEKQRLNALFS